MSPRVRTVVSPGGLVVEIDPWDPGEEPVVVVHELGRVLGGCPEERRDEQSDEDSNQ